MATMEGGYLLSHGPDEIRRLQSWGRVWEPEAETMLDHIGVQPGWRCLVHVRFLFSPLGRDEALMQELLRLLRPGGVLAAQEADECSYICYPPQDAWERLKALTAAAFARGGGDASAGRRMYGLLRRAGLQDVGARAVALALPAGHPYRRWPLESTIATRPRTREWGLMSDPEWEQLVAECERIANDPEIFLISFMVIQTWGRKPARE